MTQVIPTAIAVFLWVGFGCAAFLIVRSSHPHSDEPVRVGSGLGASALTPPEARGHESARPTSHEPKESLRRPVAASGSSDSTARVRAVVGQIEAWQTRWEEVRERMEALRERGRVAAQVSQKARNAISDGELAHLAPLVPSVVDVLLDVGVRPSALHVEAIQALILSFANHHAAHRRWADENSAGAAEREELARRRRDAARAFVAACGSVIPARDREGDFETRLLHRLGEWGV